MTAATGILGVDRDRFDPALLDATDDLASVLAVAIELGAERVEPSHVFVALTRIPNGLAAQELDERRIPPEQFGELMHRNFPGSGGGAFPTALDPDSVSERTTRVFESLNDQVPVERPIGERELLAHVLLNLEPPVAKWLDEFGHIESGGWAAELLKPEPEPLPCFIGDDEQLNDKAFSAGALRVLTTMCREAEGLGHDRLTTPLLLYAMAVTPAGLLEQSLQFLEHDVRRVRERLFALLGRARPGSGSVEVALRGPCFEPALRFALDRAAIKAARDRHALISERELLVALLDSPGGIAAAFFADARIDSTRVVRFATDYYQETEPEPEARASLVSFDEAVRELQGAVLGQEAALEQLRPHLRRLIHGLELGYRRKNRPAAAFLFCGPSGTGKTMTARVLARLLYGSEDELLMFEMGQFNARESMNNFVGAPPGYVGFGEGKLTNGLRENARRVLLFDEVEKAHADVFNALLRLLDEGKINDPAGPVRDATESVIVLTSNLGASEFADIRVPEDPSERQELRDRVREILGGFFRPEFLNRIDEMVLFTSFDREDLLAIAELELGREARRFEEQLDLQVTWTSTVPAHAVERALAARREEAARGIGRTVEELVPELLDAVHSARSRGDTVPKVVIDVADGCFVVREAERARADD